MDIFLDDACSATPEITDTIVANNEDASNALLLH